MNCVIQRDPTSAQAEAYDIVIVGGGILGASATLAAAEAGHRALLLERDDFGGATSWNSLRILHGGLRYLQELDLPRFRESVMARSWFIREFPDLVDPLPCLMPLYDRGLRRRMTLGLALAVNRRLRRLWSSAAELEAIDDGGLRSRDEVMALFPGVHSAGLHGGALWFDGLLARPQRMLIEILRRAVGYGATCLNYVEATGWTTAGGRIATIRGRDSLNGTEFDFRTSAVLNCAGPWAASLAATDDRQLVRRFHPSLAFNLLLNRRLESDVAVAVEPASGGKTYFLMPLGEQTLAGTYHAAVDSVNSRPTEVQIENCLADLRAAVPTFQVGSQDVLRVMAGVLPARGPNDEHTARRSLRSAAADHGGPRGLFSLIAAKYTTAPLTAAKVVDRILARSAGAPGVESYIRPPIRRVPAWPAFREWAKNDPEAARRLLETVVAEESVLDMEDLLLRRTDWGFDPEDFQDAEELIYSVHPHVFPTD